LFSSNSFQKSPAAISLPGLTARKSGVCMVAAPIGLALPAFSADGTTIQRAPTAEADPKR